MEKLNQPGGSENVASPSLRLDKDAIQAVGNVSHLSLLTLLSSFECSTVPVEVLVETRREIEHFQAIAGLWQSLGRPTSELWRGLIVRVEMGKIRGYSQAS